jgi:hypothetical protein
VILRCNYEELQALRAGGRSLLEGEAEMPTHVPVPAESRVCVEALLRQLVGDLDVPSISEARSLRTALDAIVEHLRAEMEAVVMATHAADEDAVAAYFDFAHALSVFHRLEHLVAEMEALVELLTGEPVDEEVALTFRFPDE